MPTIDKDERPAVEYSQTGEVAVNKAVSEHRRKIIKASVAAVPAIMTLHSGAAAAAAMNSSYQCFIHGADATNVDRVIGDGDGIPHDEWLRMEAIMGYFIEPNYYGVKNTESTWVNASGWTWYYINQGGNFKTKDAYSDPIGGGWDSKTAFYYIAAIPGVSDAACLVKGGTDIISSISPDIIAEIEASETLALVKLLCYYNPDDGTTICHPMDMVAPAHPITESCMCSIRPEYKLLG